MSRRGRREVRQTPPEDDRLSLHPLEFEEALGALLGVPQEDDVPKLTEEHEAMARHYAATRAGKLATLADPEKMAFLRERLAEVEARNK
jgi:hypothetical protein